jgi:Flp pilus assembly protein TadD
MTLRVSPFFLLLLPAMASARTLSLEKVDTEPTQGRIKPTPEQLAALADEVTKHPESREARFALVRGKIDAGDLDGALAAARAWREKDAYNLVVIRLVGDILSEQGKKDDARRAYSSVVELLPHDAEAQRALATVEKQAGDLDGAYERLKVASEIASTDPRMRFELADLAGRTNHANEARTLFEGIVSDKDATIAVRYPAKQRLAGIYSADKRANPGDAARLDKAIADLEIHGGTTNDIKVYLSWDSDRSDIDLWVTTPSKEKVFYSHKIGKNGEALFDDVTTGYGPESFTAKDAQPGTYTVQVDYFGTRRSAFPEARGEVTVVLHEGSADETRFVLPYRLFQVKQTVTVAKIKVQ